MLAFAALFAAAVLPIASATLHITQPTGAGWIGNSTVTVAWSWDTTDPTFSIELANPTIQSGLLAQGPIAVGNNIPPNTNTFSFLLPVIPAGGSYSIRLVNIFDVLDVYAESASFTISDNPASTTATGTSTRASGSTSGTVSASRTSSSSSSSASGTSTGTVVSTTSSGTVATTATTTESRTFLQVTTFSSSASASSTSTTKNAASALVSTNGVAGIIISAVALCVGAIVVV